MKKKTFIILLAALLIIVAAAAIIYPRLSASYQDNGNTSGNTIEQAPDFTVYDNENKEVSLSYLKGTPVIVNFWATWCGYCMDELPAFDHMAEKYGNHAKFMMVDLVDGSRETMETASSFIKEQGYTFPVYYDSDQSAAYTYGLNSIPVTLFIDADGNLFYTQIGAMDEKTLEKNIMALLDGAAPEQKAPKQEAGCSFH